MRKPGFEWEPNESKHQRLVNSVMSLYSAYHNICYKLGIDYAEWDSDPYKMKMKDLRILESRLKKKIANSRGESLAKDLGLHDIC